MIRKVDTELNFAKREEEVLSFWKDKDIFKKSMNLHKGGPTYTFYDGPPTANGKPHIGHILTRAYKDVVPRYRSMKGCHVLRKAGWDTHGLPVELEVEKQLGLDGKPQIEKYGVEPFVKKCKESVWTYKSLWEKMSDRVGFWADMEQPYVTYENNYIESVWWSLKKIWEQDLLYHGHKVVPYCPRCGTALSSHETAQGYKDVVDNSLYVRFAVKGEENTYILAWTTTPWTLPSNVALCVNANEDYVLAKDAEGRQVYLAKALLASVVGEDAPVLKEFKGSELVGTEYEPLFPYAQLNGKRAHFVVADNYVTLSDGTGVVHIAPAFGEDDARIGRANDLPFVQLVDAQGRFVPGTATLEGLFVKDGDPVVIEELTARGLVVRVAPYEHSYPFCWRCDTPLIYYARATWFIRVTAMRDKLMASNRSVNWLPGNIKEGRMGDFIENVIDWGLSRERYWGTPLPMWQCQDCGHEHMIGSIEELKQMGKDVPDDIELHKPYIDRVHLSCPKCHGDMKRVPEVIDCWYDSGSMPFAQWHYPFENKELFEQNFPANFISEAVDQTRGWFYSLLTISTLLFEKSSFENCIVLGHVGDKDGVKMSKHKGNVVDPWTVLEKQGADAIRWYFFASSAPWLPIRYYDEGVSDYQRRFMGTLWNTYAFFCLYASIDGYVPAEHPLSKCELGPMDRWVLSRLSTLVKTVDTHMDAYRITEAARAIQDFVDELSNWYLRLTRGRFWGEGMHGDKEAAFATLHHVLETLSRLIAPFVPFIAEQMYQNLVCATDSAAPESVHLCDFPVADEAAIDADLERDMAQTMRVVGLARTARSTAGIKVRQPLSRLIVRGAELPDDLSYIAAEELNVKEVEFVDDARSFTTYALKPQLRTLGRKYGKLVPQIGQWLQTVDGNAAMETLNAGQPITTEIDGTPVELFLEDVLSAPAQKEGFVAETDRDLTVVLDTRLSEELIREGLVRETVSKLQNQRKEAGFEVADRIAVGYQAEDELAKVLVQYKDSIMEDVLAVSFEPVLDESGFKQEWNINGLKAVLTVRKV